MSFRLRRRVLAAALVSITGAFTTAGFADPLQTTVSSPAAERGIAKSVSAALQGNSRQSVEALRAVPADQFAGEDAEYRACILERFGDRATPPRLVNATGDAEVDDALRLYQQYWWQALRAAGKVEEHDRALQQRLRKLLGERAGDWKELEVMLAQRLRKRGYYAQLGRTPPLRELMVWRTPSLLGHETQHFADLNRFPDLEPWEFEYRAKFTELWKSTDSLPVLLAKFASSQSDDMDSPHTYANKRVLSALRTRLQQPDLRDVSPHELRAAAREQLIEDSLQRSAEASRSKRLGAQAPRYRRS